MKLSLRGEYALRALLVLGLNYKQSVVRIQTIAQHQNIPKRFLEQILNDLKSAGVVESKRGVAGGYRLARPPADISLASVIRHIEGALAPAFSHKDRSGRVLEDADLFGPTAQLAGAGISNAGRPRTPIRLMIALLYLTGYHLAGGH